MVKIACWLSNWDTFRTADWAELVIDPESTLIQTKQLIALAS